MAEGRGLSRGAMIGIAVAAAVVIVAGLGVFVFFSGDNPEEVDLGSAVEAVQEATASSVAESQATTVATEAQEETADDTTPSTPETEAPADDAGVDGTWTVDTGIGTFSFEDATSSFVGFRVKETLSNVGETEAVGRTPVVSGTIEIEGTTATAASFEADLSEIVTDRSQRDRAVQRALNTGENPTASFVATAPIEFGTIPTDGEAVTFTASGDLTVNGVTQAVEFPLEAQVVDEIIVVVGSLVIEFGDFGVSVPSAPIVLGAEDSGPIEVQLFFTR